MPNYTWTTITSDENTISSLLNSEGIFSFNNFIKMPDELKRTIAGGTIKECVAYYILSIHTFKDSQEILKELNIYIDKKKTKKETKQYLLKRIGNNPQMFNDETHYEQRKDDKGVEHTYIVNENYGHSPEEIGMRYYYLYKKYGSFDWYQWANRNWGTKWDAFDIYVDKTCISFTTAWSAPEPIMAKISQLHPDAEISFCCEYEDGYYYEASNHNGELIIDSEWEKEYDEDDEDDYEGIWVNVKTGEKKGA